MFSLFYKFFGGVFYVNQISRVPSNLSLNLPTEISEKLSETFWISKGVKAGLKICFQFIYRLYLLFPVAEIFMCVVANPFLET